MIRQKVQWIAFVGVLSVVFASFGLRALYHVLNGRGAEVYRTAKGFVVHWSTAFVLVCAVLVALLVALILRWFHRR
jgi:hypothetical protein